MEFSVEPESATAGDSLGVSVSFTPRFDGHIKSVAATLRGEEVVSSGSGTTRTTHTLVLHTEIETLETARDIRARNKVALEGKLALPADAPPSFYASNNKLRWEVEILIDITHWPDYSRSVPVIVRA